MSSDSEVDEFFDAEDSSPNKSSLKSVDETKEETEDEDEELDEEEKALLELKRQQEERRRKEDEELQKRLEALKQKKREDRERKLELERKEQQERRRRKHEDIRRRITESGDNTTETTSSSQESDIEDFEDSENVSGMSETKSSIVSEQLDKYGDNLSVNINTAGHEKDKVSKHMFEFVCDPSKKTETLDHNMINTENLIEDVLQETQLLNNENEPDIVRSTKTRTPPSTLQSNSSLPSSTVVEPASGETKGGSSTEPVAPPRRKHLKLVIAGGSASSIEDTGSQRSSISSLQSDGSFLRDPQSPGLPAESSFNIGNQDLIAKEHTLDLRHMLRGRRHIVAERGPHEDGDLLSSDPDSPVKGHDQLDGGQSAESKGSSLDREHVAEGGKKRSKSSSKSSSLESNGKKTSSLEREPKKSQSSSLDSKKSKSSSLDKDEKRRSRHSSKSDSLPRKRDSLPRKRESFSRKQDVIPKNVGRPRSPSGRSLTDEEILMATMVKNLDTGETVPLKEAEVKIQKCIDPLVLHIMERTNDYPSAEESDKDEGSRSEGGKPMSTESKLKKKGAKLKKMFGKKVGKTVSKVKSVADHEEDDTSDLTSEAMMHGEEKTEVLSDAISEDGRRFKFKANHNRKGPYEFGKLQFVQDLSGEHVGAIWTMKFSPCGRLLATGGQDSVLRIWVLESAFQYFDDMRQKYVEMKVSPAPSQESLNSLPSSNSDVSAGADLGATAESEDERKGPFKTKPFCRYRGHTADLLDVSWSKNYFILSSSMDKTVRLWHISRRECLCTFQHIDFVTAIVFHPKDDRYFLSGSLDGKLRLWNIPDKKVSLWNEVGNGSLITTANFCHNGKFAVVGTYDGKCIFYSTEHLKYYTQIHVRSTRGKNSRGRKITGIEPLPGEDKVLVTSNDSRVRLYDLRDLTLTCKYKGLTNASSQIRATFSPKGRYVISGSEDHFVYMWRTQHEFDKFSSARRDRNDYYEAVKVHNAVATSAVFAPNPAHFLNSDDCNGKKTKETKDAQPDCDAEFFVSADFLGSMKVVRAK